MTNSTAPAKPSKPKATRQRYAVELMNHARGRWVAGDSINQIAEAIGAPRSSVRRWLEGVKRGQQQVVQLSREASEALEPWPVNAPSAHPGAEGEPAAPGARGVKPDSLSEPAPIAFPDIDQIGARLILGNANALDAIHRLLVNPEWLLGQSAEAIAGLYRVLSDKGIRILSAVRAPEPEVSGGV